MNINLKPPDILLPLQSATVFSKAVLSCFRSLTLNQMNPRPEQQPQMMPQLSISYRNLVGMSPRTVHDTKNKTAAAASWHPHRLSSLSIQLQLQPHSGPNDL